jgi:hypothetical protein
VRRFGVTLAAGIAAVAVAAPSASATSTRAEYVAQVDPICKAARSQEKDATRSFKRQVRRLRERGVNPEEPTKQTVRLGVAFYNRILRITQRRESQISVVIPAPGDEEARVQWLQARGKAIDLFQRGVHAFARGKEQRSSGLLTAASEVWFMAQFLVEDFGFRYCVEIDPGP